MNELNATPMSGQPNGDFQSSALANALKVKRRNFWFRAFSVFVFFAAIPISDVINDNSLSNLLSAAFMVTGIAGFIIGVFKMAVINKTISHLKQNGGQIIAASEQEFHGEMRQKGFNSVLIALAVIAITYLLFALAFKILWVGALALMPILLPLLAFAAIGLLYWVTDGKFFKEEVRFA